MTLFRLALGVAVAAYALQAQAPPEFAVLDAAYGHLREARYDEAIAAFRQAAALAPERVAILKDLGYTLLKVGDSIEARDAFARAMELDPADTQVALEFAFLANDTGRRREARRVFAKWKDGNATAAQAFANIDGPLAEGLARWQAVVASDAGNFSAHEEVARLAEERDMGELAEQEYEAAWELRPDRRDLLVARGRLLEEMGDAEAAMTVLLAASRGPDPRTAEHARRLLPQRYPFVYEFRNAIAYDPTNLELRRELGYLLIAMGDGKAGQKELDALEPLESREPARALQPLVPVPTQPVGLKERGSDGAEVRAPDVRTMGMRSYEAGYLPDAVRYLGEVVDQDPLDFEAMLRLAWSFNLLHRDREAIPWFQLATKSPDPAIAEEARAAWKRLTPGEQPTQTSVWAFPTFSTRWNTLFGYGQWRTDVKLPFIKLRTYVSTRVVGDSRGAFQQPGIAYAQYLSESSIIPAIGVTTNTWRGMRLWGEAGVAWSYLAKQGQSRTQQDYRGGLALVRSYGTLIGASKPGLFREHDLDALYVHRFNKTFLVNWRNRVGFTVPTEAIRMQFTWNANINADPRRQYWANFVETGPGIRFRFPFMPPSMLVTADAVRGVYTVNEGNPRRPNFNDIRVGVWYSVSH